MPIPGLSAKTYSPRDWKPHHVLGLRRRPSQNRPLPSGPKRRHPFKRFFKVLLVTGLIGIAAVGVSAIAVVSWVAGSLPDPNRIIEREVAQSTKIFDRTGKSVLFDIHGEQKRTLVKLNELPKSMLNATITAEDRKFYEHGGISFTGILRSLWIDLTRGGKVQGGSTLTQQLIKNAILSPEKTYTRKIKEIILAYQIEKRFSKDQILQLYFNEIPYGSTAYGVEAASQTYFGKSARDLDLAECALLASLPKAPSYYSPYGSHKDELIARQHFILDGMAEGGYITDEEAELAKKQEPKFKEKIENIVAPHFVMYVRDYLTQKYGELAVEQGGLQVTTTLDLNKQKIAEEAIAAQAEKNLKLDATNAALVSLDPKTGQILAMVGSKDFFDATIDGQVNVTDRLRQPGSSFKPIVYSAAFKKGFTPDTLLYDVNTKFLNYDGTDYEPHNYDGKEHGPLTMRKALAGSLNIPAVKIIYLTGVDNVIDLAEALGYSSLTPRSRFGLSLVLGGAEVTLLEHAAAYAVFAREGEYHPPVAILEVKDKDGNVLEEYQKTEKKVLDTQIARQINSIITDNSARAFIFGEQNFLTLGDRLVGAKTGTTNDFRDAWTMGFTPSLVTGVWVGNNDNHSMKRGADGSVVAAPIWHAYMEKALAGTPAETFSAPDPITTDKPALNGTLVDGIKVKIDRISGKLATNLTPENTVEEHTYQQTHDILYWINKDDPQGPTPPDHESEQFKRWEEAVARWAGENNIVSQEPPTEFDDVHTLENRPSISLLEPSSGATLDNRALTARVSASAPRGVRRVEYYLGDQRISTVTAPPFDLQVILQDPSLRNGFYTLKAVAYDDIDNSSSASVEITLQLPQVPASLNWELPAPDSRLESASFPVTVRARLVGGSAVTNVSFLYRTSDGTEVVINSLRPNTETVGVFWTAAPPPGAYELFAEITNADGFSYRSSPLPIVLE